MINSKMRQDLAEKVLEKVVKDPEFRHLLVVDPEKAFDRDPALKSELASLRGNQPNVSCGGSCAFFSC